MQYLKKLFLSSATTMVLLVLLIILLGTATFVEDKYDTVTANQMIYDSWWFEMIFILLAVNLVGHIIRFRMIQARKWGSLTFHLAFLVIILGAGLTRHFGFEGSMHIREGEESNVIWSQDPWFVVHASGAEGQQFYSRPFRIGSGLDNKIGASFEVPGKGEVTVELDSVMPNAVQRIRDNQPGGADMITVLAADQQNQQTLMIRRGETATAGPLTFAFDAQAGPEAVVLTVANGTVTLQAPFDIYRTDMMQQSADTLKAGTPAEVAGNRICRTNDMAFMVTGFHPSATMVYASGTPEEQGTDALAVQVTAGGKSYPAIVFGGTGYLLKTQEYDFGGVKLAIGYGERPIELPFSIRLNDFILDRYAGSMSPSSYASEVTLIDKRKNLSENHRIFMNNVLDYDQYRFFQSSYDKDEKGTVLSVNHDFWGTLVTYIGYGLLALGFIITLLTRGTRFHLLPVLIGEARAKRRALPLIAGLLLVFGTAVAQNPVQPPVSPAQAEAFGRLMVQTYDGRFEPVNSLACDVLHKISRKDRIDAPGKGDLDPVQVLMDMVMDPEYWKQQRIIYIREKSVRDLIGISDKYASLNDFLDPTKGYKLREVAEEAFRKKQSEQNNRDKEIIKVDERLNILEMALNGSILRIFPVEGDANNKWISIRDKGASEPLGGILERLNDQLQVNPLTYTNLLSAYFQGVHDGAASGNYGRADQVRTVIADIQRNSPARDLLASDTRISAEILYNRLQIFITLRNVYALLSVLLLFLAFIDNLRKEKSRILTLSLNILTGILALAFLYHTFGMGIRWYLTGHAPWSNGYESLILIAWSALLAGFTFARYSKITLAATTLLAFFVLMTASHSSYDPQLTNLQPVLKSYWLIIHVATLTISYGFLGLGFILGLMNMVIYLFKNVRNATRLNLLIDELTFINEMNLIVGIALATVGTFLGGVWANESWGRYWGWDAKETWALVIVIAYTVVLHLRFIPFLRSRYIFNIASIAGFGSVIMTFVGVNYYLSKGMHSYGQGDTPVFPLWAWGIILSMLLLIVGAGLRSRQVDKSVNTALKTE